MNYKLVIITPLLILLITLSGCIHLLSTAEREACLSATHFSTNSIDVCETQRECYNKIVDNQVISNKLPLSIYNHQIIYLNNIASASFNFNHSEKYLKELNKSCDVEDVNKIIKSSNDLFTSLRNIFEYIDKANSESIILIKDYTIYLESEGIDQIPEEQLYSEYVLLNNNLNELKVDSKNDNYVHNLMEESAKLNLIAEDFGFEKNYISDITYFDLTSYYLKLVENPSGKIRVPTVVPGLNYVLGEFSNLEQLKNITINLQRADNYNFYMVLDKLIGKNNSLHSSFNDISKNINQEIDQIYIKIYDLEETIEENIIYISSEDYATYTDVKIEFREKRIGFGTYISILKKINNNIGLNKIKESDQNIINSDRLRECNEIIDSAEKLNNTYLNKLVKDYKNSTNIEIKIGICNQLNLELNNASCMSDLSAILNVNTTEFEGYKEIYLNEVTQNDCINILNNINNYLENNEKINLLKTIIKGNISKTIEINEKIEVSDLDSKITIVDVNAILNQINNEPNYKLYINIDTKINEQQKINNKLLEIANKVEEEYLQNSYRIELIDSNYYLILPNKFSFELTNIELKINELDSNIYFYAQGISISRNVLSVNKLFPNNNYFQINYQNRKEITINLLELDLENTLFEIIIKNQIEGIKDKIYMPPERKLVDGVVDEKNYFNYITESENRILFTEGIFTNTIISNKYELLTNNKYINKIELKIKNNFEKDVSGKIKLIEIDSVSDQYVAYLLKANNREQGTYIEGNGLYTEISLSKGEEEVYELQTLRDFNEIILIAKENILKINRLENSRFLDLKRDAISEFSSIDDLIITQDSKFDELQKVFNKENKLNELKIRELGYIQTEDLFFVLYNYLIIKPDISLTNKNKIDKLNDTKYTNIMESLRQLKLIEKSYITEKESKLIEQDNINYNKLQEFKNKISDFNIVDSEITKLILDADYTDQTDLNQIEKKINENIKLKAEEINKLLQKIDEIRVNKDADQIEKVRWMFEDFGLDELYAQGYFPSLTIADVDRYEKKQKFLDTQTLNTEILEFNQNLDAKDYERAINSISSETITRLKDIFAENEFINIEMSKIKNDSKNKLNAYIEENKNTHKQEIKDKITLAKNYYSNGKYLNVMSLLQKKTTNSKSIRNNQILIICVILFILLLLGLYYRVGVKKKKEINYQERKKRVIRHN